jgi:hypothetical protein
MIDKGDNRDLNGPDAPSLDFPYLCSGTRLAPEYQIFILDDPYFPKMGVLDSVLILIRFLNHHPFNRHSSG